MAHSISPFPFFDPKGRYIEGCRQWGWHKKMVLRRQSYDSY